ncbi:hypothetical protein [Truepera radiovictrix]|uniref:A-factor biosynthesis hotdog domain-containing protein n=1 Tax=Truepera radiovictrix (strain DSM 17093 / CIP 108686 / LMG 22925 / RQ-24) TaxID=649638 RepID=D7CUE6_TRURR|nr:hypothetical protein [Truepera radiovictrix]ADI15731.1 conserved hypothetical protein [Truepera radiovictrix DSM 17093]WMT58643.1 hypothetical protein RCV51_06770 [Truepera radiovictrix]
MQLPVETTPTSAALPGTPVSETALLTRICVSRPYFALDKLRAHEGRFYATAAADLPLGREVGPMSSAEISRHAAIAGLCGAALAQGDDDRRFYLAQRAEFYALPSAAPYGTPVSFCAQLEDLNKRSARSSITASVGDEPLARLEVSYTILTEYAFRRLFRHRARATAPRARMCAALPGRLSVTDTASYEVPAVPEAACAGHFASYPALPVALLVGQLGDTASHLLATGAFRGVRASVVASDLCWAGEAARFEVRRAPEAFADERALLATGIAGFDCRVLAGEREVCTAKMLLEPR